MAQFLGGSLQPVVAKQLKARSEYLKAGKFQDGLTALHGNSPFINLYSSVMGSPYSSNDFKLEGGLAFQADIAPGDPVGYSRSIGDDQRSFTPRPGIIDANVKSKGTFGALRDVEVSVKAFNVGDFEIIYDLYCRPGFSFFLEWGHTVYIDDNGKQSTIAQSASGKFLSGGKYDEIQAEMAEAKRKSHGNYDAILAICKNFNWTLNTDGSYDIKLSLISKGEVIESIKSSFDPNILEKNPAALVTGNADKSERKSLLHYFCKRLELAAGLGSAGELDKGACAAALSVTTPGFASKLDASTLYAASVPGFDIKSPTSFFDDSCVFIYISLRTILTVLNASMMFKGNNQKAVTFKTKTNSGKPGYEPHYNNYFTHPQHHSINPWVCVIPNLNGKNAFWEAKPAESDLHAKITARFKNSDDVLDICVSNLYLYEKLDAIYDDDQAKENEPGVFDVIKAILGGVGEALGGVNEFDLNYDEEYDEWAIVDRKCRLSPKAKAPEVIDLVGLGSFAYDFKTESKITNKLASMVSIGAQASGTGTKQNVAEMLQWNRGHYDRIFPRTNEGDKQLSKDDQTALAQAAKDKAEWNDRCKEAFDKFNGVGMFTDQQYDPDLFKGIQSGHQTAQSQALGAVCEADGIPAPGTIPVELSFTLHGIGGFRIGETFKLSEASSKVLPKAYSQSGIGFIITKVDHKIDEGGWKTDIGALMYNLNKFDNGGGGAGFLAGMGASGGTAVPQLKPPPKDDGTPVDPNATDKLQNQTALGTNVSYDAVKAAVLNKKYQWFSGDLQLNIVGVRNSAGQISDGAGGVKHPLTNRFTDIVIVAWIENGQKFAESYPATTVPGASWSLSTNRKFASSTGKNANGVGIMKEKQFINQYTRGMHHGGSSKPHSALRSVSGQAAHRDKNYSDNWLTLAVSPVGKLGAAQAGLFSDGGGMQLHNSGASTAANKTVDNWSAGCQVFANEKQHNRLMELVGKSEKKNKTNKFSYTLLNNKEIRI
jgi:hypothetical protein